MDDLQKCAQLYSNLLNFEYKFIVARKGNISEINLKFSENEFYHLLGLHKLKDLNLNALRKPILKNILSGKLALSHVQSSIFYQGNPQNYIIGIADRVQNFLILPLLLESNDLIFRYNQKVFPSSKITASYLLEYKYKVPLYLFLDQCKEGFYCKSFFPFTTLDYTQRQTKLTLLQKVKYNRKTGEKNILYSRLEDTPRN